MPERSIAKYCSSLCSGISCARLPRERQLVADHLGRMNGDRPGVDGPRQRLAVAIDDVAALGDRGGQPFLAPGMITEGGEIEDAKRDERDDARHTPACRTSAAGASRRAVCRRCPTSRSRSGRGATRAGAVRSSVGGDDPWVCPNACAGSGASGSTFASRTGFVIGFAAATACLSTDFLGDALAADAAAGFSGRDGPAWLRDWPAFRAGFAVEAGLAAVAGLSASFEHVAGAMRRSTSPGPRASRFSGLLDEAELAGSATGCGRAAIVASRLRRSPASAPAPAPTPARTGAWNSTLLLRLGQLGEFEAAA